MSVEQSIFKTVVGQSNDPLGKKGEFKNLTYNLRISTDPSFFNSVSSGSESRLFDMGSCPG